jgi:hypothetical protein
MSLTENGESNKILSHHIRTSSKQNAAEELVDPVVRVKQLAEVVHYAPLLRLKVRFLDSYNLH